MLRNRRNVPKQLDAVLDTWIRMDTSESDSPSVGLPHLPKVSRVISVLVLKCLQTLRHRCRSVRDTSAPNIGAEVSWGRSVRKAQSLLPVRKCLGILWLVAAHAHCSQYMPIVDNYGCSACLKPVIVNTVIALIQSSLIQYYSASWVG